MSVLLLANTLKSDVQPAPVHSGSIAPLATCAPAEVQLSVAVPGFGWLNGHAAMNAGPAPVLNTVKLSVTARAFTGMPQLDGLPPCEENVPVGLVALKLCVAPAANEPPTPKRESRMRHGVIGV